MVWPEPHKIFYKDAVISFGVIINTVSKIDVQRDMPMNALKNITSFLELILG